MTVLAGTPRVLTPDGPRPAPRAGDARVDALLHLVQEQLGMDVAFVNEFVDDRRRFRAVSDQAGTGPVPGAVEPREGTYCQLIVDGDVAEVLPDTRAHPRLRDASHTASLDIGAYVGVPVRRTDGSLYGTLCAYSHHAVDELGERDARVLRSAAQLLTVIVEEEESAERARDAELRRLDDLLESGGPDLVFQPMTTLSTIETVGFEVLSRFPSGTGSPDEWFAAAHEVGVGARLELAALDRAAEAMGRIDGYVAINISASTVTAPGFGDHVAHLPLERIVLEITEHEPVHDYDELCEALRPLRERGLRLAIDDAGAGFASMRHVIALEPDIIKLDISLVRGIDEHLGRQAFAAAMLAFAGKIDATTVAEGIETEAELERLREIGVQYGQGFHLARPHPVPTPVARRPDLFDA